MATPIFTLEYKGTNKSFGDWGIEAPVRRRRSQEISVFTFNLPGARVDDAPLFDFEEWLIIRRDAEIIFQGRRVLNPIDGRPEFEGVSYEIADPWYDLATTCFQQAHHVYKGDPNNLATSYLSDLFLFLKIDAPFVKQNTREQIIEILNYAIAQGAQLQIGTIEPQVNAPSYHVRDIMCSEAIQNCLRSRADSTSYFDYTTTPPTLHVRLRANLTPKTLPYADGLSHQATKLTARPDLQVPSVSLKFRRTNTVDGFSWVEPMDAAPNWQLYPLDKTGTERRALVQTIDLEGYNASTVHGHLEVAPVQCNDADATVRRAWWATQHPQLANGKLREFTIGDATIVNKNTGAPIDLAEFPNALKAQGGQVAEWMKIGLVPIKAVEAVIQAQIIYKQFTTEVGGQEVHTREASGGGNIFSAQLTVTNGATGDYSTVESETAAEEIPAGLAQALFEGLAVLQYEGSHQHIDPSGEIQGVIGMDNVVNLSGGAAAWQAMNATIQEIEEDFTSARTTVVVGPAKHLTAGDLTALFLFNRFRYTFKDPATRATAQANANNKVTLGQQTPKQDTNHGLEELQLHTVFAQAGGKSPKAKALGGNLCVVQSDAVTQSLALQINDADGNIIAEEGSVLIDLDSTGGSDGQFHKIYLQEISVCVGEPPNQTLKKSIVLMSDPY